MESVKFMENSKNLSTSINELYANISDVYELLDILDEIIDGDRRIDPIFKVIKQYINSALENANNCKQLVSD